MKAVKIISNNPLVVLDPDDFRVSEYEVLKVLEKVRDLVHVGHHLLTNPLAGSIKPNENPYRTVAVSAMPLGIDYQSVQIAEGCLQTARRMIREKPFRNLSKCEREDFMMMDLSLFKEGGFPCQKSGT